MEDRPPHDAAVDALALVPKVGLELLAVLEVLDDQALSRVLRKAPSNRGFYEGGRWDGVDA